MTTRHDFAIPRFLVSSHHRLQLSCLLSAGGFFLSMPSTQGIFEGALTRLECRFAWLIEVTDLYLVCSEWLHTLLE